MGALLHGGATGIVLCCALFLLFGFAEPLVAPALVVAVVMLVADGLARAARGAAK